MVLKQKLAFAILLGVFFCFPFQAQSHVPVLEPTEESEFANNGLFFKAVRVEDPTKQSLAAYGILAEPGETDVYVFTPESEAEVPIELLVPIRPANSKFKPDLFIIAKDLPDEFIDLGAKLPFEIPPDYKIAKLENDHSLGAFNEVFSLERYHQGEKATIRVLPKQNYFIAVIEPNSQTGDYTIGIGSVENFSDASYTEILRNVFYIKMGLVGNVVYASLDLLGLFLFFAGFVVGLGAVTVIDVLGFLGRKSGYWTEVTIKAHKVTKPLIWLGLFILLAGAGITYRESWLTGVALIQAILIFILMLNGLFLTFYISPKLLAKEKEGTANEPLSVKLRDKIMLSFGISFIGWWASLFLLAWYVIFMR